MNEYLKIAWRNIWRNKRRTLITTASIFFAMFLALVMRSFQLGSYGHMIRSMVESYTGYIQIQSKDYWDDKTIDNSFAFNEEILKSIEENQNVSLVVPRLESFALASSGEQTKGVLVLGIDPEKEKMMSKLEDRLIKYRLTPEALKSILKEDLPEKLKEKLQTLENNSYSNSGKLEMDLNFGNGDVEKYLPEILKHSLFENKYFLENDDGVLVADRLAKFLNLSINDTIILLGQGYHGYSAAGKYPIRGLVKIPNPELDNMLVYMNLPRCQELYSVDNRLTSLSIDLKNNKDKDVKKTKKSLISELDPEIYAVKDWKELNPELVQQIESDNGGGLIMIGILYMIVAFGIFGTVLMMTAERRREFGVMIAVGMQKYKLGIIVTYEMIMVGLLAIVFGILASIPIIQWYYHNPIQLTGDLAKTMESYGMEAVMPMAWQADIFLIQTLIVLVLVAVAIFYPIYSITRIKVIKALRD